MTIDIITLFPQMFSGPFDKSIVSRAKNKGLVNINLWDLRDWSIDERGTVDDRPYGGGTGMVLRIEPIYKVLQEIKSQFANQQPKIKTVLMDPRGEKFSQKKAREYSQLVLICGHYEGVDERVRQHLVDESICIGNYVLTGGEIPAMVVTDSVTRLIPEVLGKPEATQLESFSSEDYLEHPQYTRPEDFKGWKVPKVLLTGNHKEIEKWRAKKSSIGR
jgi:tRNA (guanine37-N1)-methyltransferase